MNIADNTALRSAISSDTGGLTTINNRVVRLGAEIGHGRDTVVYAGTLEDGQQVAVKIFDSAAARREEQRYRIASEMRVATRLRSSRLVTTLDVGLDAGHPFIVMEYLAGGDLQQRLDELALWEWSDIRTLALDLARALADIHNRGFIHGDMKPQNVLFDSDNTLKIGDFGLTRHFHARALGGTAAVGTIGFIAPEVVMGEAPGPQADVYALGVILFLLSTGRMPFTASSPLAIAMAHVDDTVPVPSSYNPSLPTQFDALVKRSLAKDPRRRFRDACSMYRVVRALPRESGSSFSHWPTSWSRHVVNPAQLLARLFIPCNGR